MSKATNKVGVISRRVKDGVTSLVNSLANTRNPLNTNVITSTRLDQETLRIIYRTGLANKISRIKSSYSLNNTILFENDEDELFYDRRLKKAVREAVTFMLAFGRGIIVLHQDGADLSKPLPRSSDPDLMKLTVFSGDMVTVSETSRDISNPRYYKPILYNVRGHQVHYSRVIDYTYIEPTQQDKVLYSYGGISEYELIYNQLVNDGIIERAGASIIEKNSTLFYKLKGFAAKLSANKEQDVVRYMGLLEDMRGIQGAGVIDSEDDVMSVSQSLSDFKDVADNSLRRIAMVTDIPLAILIGENVKGLNSTGDNELKIFQDSIKNLQENYILNPTNQLMRVFERKRIAFKEVQWETPLTRMQYHNQALVNAKLMQDLGEDAGKYLQDLEIIQPSKWDDYFEEVEDVAEDELLLGEFDGNGN